jgi:hypothetical protein
MLLPTLQSGNTKRQSSEERVQQSNNTNKDNVQHKLNGENEQRQSTSQWVQEDQEAGKSQDCDSSSDGREDLDDDESKQRTNGDELALLLGLSLKVDNIGFSNDRALLSTAIDVWERIDLVGGGCNGGCDEVDLSADLGRGSGLLEETRGCRERSKSGVWGLLVTGVDSAVEGKLTDGSSVDLDGSVEVSEEADCIGAL